MRKALIDDYKIDHTFLNKAYEEALENGLFKEIVSQLNLDASILKKYTSLLEDASQELKNCRNCQGLFECQNKVNGYCYSTKVTNEQLNFSYHPCKYLESIEKKTNHNVKYFDVPTILQDANINDIDISDKKRHEVILWFKTFLKSYNKNSHPKGLYLYGNFGCGKTYLTIAMLNELAKKNIKVAIVFFPEFLRSLKDSFATNFSEKIEYIKKIEILFIDDIGAEAVTNWGRDEILLPILQYRMDEGLTTFFASNLNFENLEEHLSVTKDQVSVVKARRIVERIKQMTEYKEMISKNLRK